MTGSPAGPAGSEEDGGESMAGGRPGRDQVAAMERLVRLITSLNASERGVPADRLLDVVHPEEGDPDSRRRGLNRDIAHLNQLGYDIRNVSGRGEDAVYVMHARDNRLLVDLDAAQRGELVRAAVQAGRDDLASHLSPEPPGAHRPVPDDPRLDLALRAASRRCLVRFEYKGRPRVVHPAGVHSGPSGWYLRGHEDGSDLVKEFVVSRMSQVALDRPGTAAAVPRAPRATLDPLGWAVDRPVDVVIGYDEVHRPVVEAVLGAPRHVAAVGGELQATYLVSHRAVFRWRLYELGTRVRVVAPEGMRQEIVRELTAHLAVEPA